MDHKCDNCYGQIEALVLVYLDSVYKVCSQECAHDLELAVARGLQLQEHLVHGDIR